MSIITLQFGQCGNQIGQKLYEFLYEDTNLSKLSKNNGNYYADSKKLWFHVNKNGEWQPRSVLIDTEDKVTSNANNQSNYTFKNVVSKAAGGSANNWAFGYKCKSELLINEVRECVRKEVERCDYLSCFLNILSAAGGTGSGVGSRIIKSLCDDYSNKILVNALVLPYHNGEVVTQNYNTLLTLSKLYKYSDATLFFENDKLHTVCSQTNKSSLSHEISYNDINAIVVQQLAGICQPVEQFSLPMFVSQLTPHPSFKFLQIKSAPHVLAANLMYESLSTWPSLLKSVFQSINKDELELKSLSKVKSQKRLKCVGSMFVSRGNDSMKHEELRPYVDTKTFVSWLPIEERFRSYHQPQQLKDSHKYLSVVLNSNNIGCVLNEILEEAWNLFTSGAYLHHYQKFGIDETYFLKAFQKLETVLHEYSSL